MSDLSDLSLPSYPTFPATLTSEEPPFPTDYDLPHPPPLIPTPGSNMASSQASLTPDNMRTVMNTPVTGSGEGNDHHLKYSTPPNENLALYTSSNSPLSSVGALSCSHGTAYPSNMPYQAATSGSSSLGHVGTAKAPTSISDVSFDVGGTLSSDVRPFTSSQEPWGSSLSTPEPVKSSLSTLESKDSSGHVGGADLSVRMHKLEHRCAKLTKERADMEEMFGRQRKAFMNQMSHTEKQLTMCKSRIDSYEKESRLLKVEVEEKEKQLTESAIRAANIRENFDADRVKYEEEIASLKAIVTGELPNGQGKVLEDSLEKSTLWRSIF